jgi:hypothetical protein
MMLDTIIDYVGRDNILPYLTLLPVIVLLSMAMRWIEKDRYPETKWWRFWE